MNSIFVCHIRSNVYSEEHRCNQKNHHPSEIEKNDSGISGEHNISPVNESLYPYLDSVSPEVYLISPDDQDNTK
jgi:hypothetical protein